MDVHHHFNPTGHDNEGRPWTVAAALEGMDGAGIATAIASLGPIHDPGPDRVARIRGWNEWATTLCRDHPGRFGLFALLPMADPDAAVAEIAHAFDVLGADGIGVSTNEGDVWLPDDRNAPVFEELDRRGAVVFVHPAPTPGSGALSRSYGGDAVTPPWIEFPVHTARVILGLLTKGIARRHSNIRFIFAHGGGVMPILLGRFAGFRGWDSIGPDGLARLFPDGLHAGFARFRFECAQACAPEAVAMLRRLVPDTHILFGSDFSYFPLAHAAAEFAALDLDDAARRAIGRDNAAALFPRLLGTPAT